MGFFDRVKAAFDAGGIKIKLAVPNNFHWGDETIPVSVTLTGHKSEQRRVQELVFQLEDEDEEFEPGDQQNPGHRFGRRVRIDWVREGVIELDPGQSVTLDIPVVVAQVEPTGPAEENKTIGRVMGVASLLGVAVAPKNIRQYRITVHAPVDGAKRTKSSSQIIRQGGGLHISPGRITLG